MKVGDLNDVRPWRVGGAPPPGDYTVRVADASEGTSSGGHPQIELTSVVVDGEYEGAEVYDWIVAIESTKGKVRQLVDAFNVEVVDGELEIAKLIGRCAIVAMRNEPKRDDPTQMVCRPQGYRSLPAVAKGARPSDDGDVPF